jgi:cell division protein FtsN
VEQTREQLEQQPPTSTGIAADMKRLTTDASSTAEEVREFIKNLKGRSPQEVLGAVSESGLVQATIQATIGCVVVLGILSVIPWMMKTEEAVNASETPDGSAAVAGATGEANSETAASQAGTSSNTTSTDPSSGSDTPTGTDAARAAKAMKIDETVVTDPKKNPLDSGLDKLLDGLD